MTVSTLVILGLAVVWAIVLLPEAIKKFRTVRNCDSIASFSRNLSHLERSNPRVRRGTARPTTTCVDLGQHRRDSAGPPSGRRSPPRTRRGLARSAPPSPGGPDRVWSPPPCSRWSARSPSAASFLVPHLVADVLLVAYVLCLHQVTNQASVAASARTASVGAGRQVRPAGSTSMSRWAIRWAV